MRPLTSHEKSICSGGKLVGLDLLRGLAILGVLVIHASTAISNGYVPVWGSGVFPALERPVVDLFLWLARLGNSGVALFFVLSGYCIQISASRMPDLNVRTFYWKRFWRIYPPYLFWLLVFSLCLQPSFLSFFSHLTFTNNLHVRTFTSGAINPSFWSLPVEFQLYLMYPIVFWGLRRYAIGVTLGVTFLVTLIWQLLLPEGTLSPFCTKGAPLNFWVFWVVGACLRELHQRGLRLISRAARWKTVSWVILLFLSPLCLPLRDLGWWFFVPIYCLFTELAVFEFRSTSFRSLSRLGVISYSLYMIHQPVMRRLSPRILEEMGVPETPASLSIVIGVTLVAVSIPASVLSYKYLEMGSVALGRKLFRKVSGNERSRGKA